MAKVYIVHSIDTEGPLYEPLDATFQRLEDLFEVRGLEPTRENLGKLQRQELAIPNAGKIAEALNGHLLNYNDTWDKIDTLLTELMTDEFRRDLTDSRDRGWVFNWHCLDHIGFKTNPRRRAMGFHVVFDHYREFLSEYPDCPDAIHWHFHPISTYREAHRCATHYLRTPEIYEHLARRIIERDWFPAVFRAGFQTERPDIHLFLEQFIPFDISNMAMDDNTELDLSTDFRNGRSGDWRKAPADWSVYHPSHDDYQISGNCRRWIGRALNVMNRIASIDQREMNKAFSRAAAGKNALVGIASHDFRDLSAEVDFIRNLIRQSTSKYPDVEFEFCEAVEGFQKAAKIGLGEPLQLELIFHPGSAQDVPFIEIKTKSGLVFGPQPFLAIQTKSNVFLHDNLDFSQDGTTWFYAFHGDTLPLEDVACIGVAANDAFGHQSIRKIHAEELQ
ncbi:MAG: hypothetical protein VW875_18420 [Planctomycetaceae bacterium]